jgi:hypothetical protein
MNGHPFFCDEADCAGGVELEERRSVEVWPPSWRAEVLAGPPLITPARQFTYPMQVAGEEDAMARGALRVLVRPAAGGTFLATCALGFTNAAMPTGVFACPNPEEICLLAGGYAYVVDTAEPRGCTHLGLRPVVEVRVLAEQELLLFVGFHSLLAWGAAGQAWETRRLSWEGVRIDGVTGDSLAGFGWDLRTDKEVGFVVDLKTGECSGGAF